MRRLLFTGGALALSLALAGTVAASASTGITSPRTISLVTHQTSFTIIPVPGQTTKAPQPGDQFIITEDDLRAGSVVGHDDVNCVIVSTTDALCHGSVILEQGQVVLEGVIPFPTRGSFDVAVTGGTEGFQNVRGDATVTPGKGKAGTLVLDLIP